MADFCLGNNDCIYFGALGPEKTQVLPDHEVIVYTIGSAEFILYLRLIFW